MSLRGASYPGPGPRDWVLLAIGVAFVAMGVFVLPSARDVGVTTIAFFGACTVVFATTIVRKLRYRRLAPISAEIAGGVRIRPSRARMVGLGAGTATLGGILIAFARSGGAIIASISWLIALAGVTVLVGAALKWLPVGYLEFDPVGITIGLRRGAFTVPWDRIARVGAGEYHDNAALYLWVERLDAVLAEPPEQLPRIMAQLAWSERLVGAHVMIFTSSYGLDLPLLMRALERYIGDPTARAELARRKLTEQTESS